MQSRYLKILAVFITLIITCFQPAQAQISSFRLKTADSLFQAKRYTQSLEHYQEILKQKEYTHAMLLKMAFIEEGLGNIGQAMYYLNIYFQVSNDKEALHKMEELADKYHLEGYKTSETDQFLTFYYENYSTITFAVAALVIFFLSTIFYTRVKLHRRPIVSGFFMLVFLITFFLHLNFGERVKTGIIANSSTYIMDGPSPGASLVEIIDGGHRVEVIGKKDVWLKIRWNGDIAYVKENSILPVQL